MYRHHLNYNLQCGVWYKIRLATRLHIDFGAIESSLRDATSALKHHIKCQKCGSIFGQLVWIFVWHRSILWSSPNFSCELLIDYKPICWQNVLAIRFLNIWTKYKNSDFAWQKSIQLIIYHNHWCQICLNLSPLKSDLFCSHSEKIESSETNVILQYKLLASILNAVCSVIQQS